MRKIVSALIVVGALMFHGEAALATSGAGVGVGAGALSKFVNETLLGICAQLGMSSCPSSNLGGALSPQIAEIAALSNGNPGEARTLLSAPAALGPPIFNDIFPVSATVSAVNPPLSVSGPLPALLSSLTPLAFISGFDNCVDNLVVCAGATLLDDPAANSFFYAVTTGADGQLHTLDLFFDYPPQTLADFTKGQDLGDITLRLAVLSRDGSERSVAATLQISAACTGGPNCLNTTVVGDFLGTGTSQQHKIASVGLSFHFHFVPSPNSSVPHAIFEVRVPLLVTAANDPAYFGIPPSGPPVATGVNQISGIPTAFHADLLGFSPPFLGVPVGIAPGAASFSASFSNNADGISHPAVAAFLAIGTDGKTLGHILRYCASPGFGNGCH